MSTITPPRASSTREQVLEHATALIRERGFRATSIGDLLERAGIQKGSFYYYFPSKEDLGHAVLDRFVEDLEKRLLDFLTAPAGPQPLERIGAVLDGFVAQTEASGGKGGCPFGTLAMELADVHDGFRVRLSDALKRLEGAFADLLGRAREAGELRRDADPKALASFVMAGLEGGMLLAKTHRDVACLRTPLHFVEAHLASYRTAS
jgi:TetR/AcrR family transcriptional repressor of nem operon